MRIQESTVQLSASHEASSTHTLMSETTLSFPNLFKQLSTTEAAPTDNTEAQLALLERVRKMMYLMLETILAAMEGKKCRGADPCGDFAAGNPAQDGNLPADGRQTLPNSGLPTQGLPTMTWRQTVVEHVQEKESTQVCGRGLVKTCDGREISFDFAVNMAREFKMTRVSEERGEIVLRDPLVVNFSGTYGELAATRFQFDLDADGSAEWIPDLKAGNAFLVFDRNANGRADDGSELFGTRSGNGFADLVLLDQDRNGWIDEADEAFARLSVWRGEDFRSLTQAGIGALSTAAVNAPFSLKTSDNELLGQIRAAGVYLRESGQVGLMQQIDLAASNLPSGQQEPGKGERLQA